MAISSVLICTVYRGIKWPFYHLGEFTKRRIAKFYKESVCHLWVAVFNKIGALGGIRAPGCVSMRVNSVLLPQSGLFIKGSLGISKGHLAISKVHLPISKGHLAISNPSCMSMYHRVTTVSPRASICQLAVQVQFSRLKLHVFVLHDLTRSKPFVPWSSFDMFKWPFDIQVTFSSFV